MRKIIFLLFILVSSFILTHHKAVAEDNFGTLPVQHEGRIKPVDTFARTMLLQFYGQRSLPNMSASSWLKEMLFNPASAYKRPVFNIDNPSVVHALELQWSPEHRYSFDEVSAAIRKHSETIDSLKERDENARTKDENDLINLYIKTLWYFDISRSLSLVLPDFKFENETYATQVGLKAGEHFSYLYLLENQSKFDALFKSIEGRSPKQAEDKEKELFLNAINLQRYGQDIHSKLFAVVPPQFNNNAWTSPWQTLASGNGSPNTAKFLDMWTLAIKAYRAGNEPKFNEVISDIHTFSYQMAGGDVSAQNIYLETLKNKAKLFEWSVIFYVGAFLLLMFGFMYWREKLHKAAMGLLVFGGVLHTVGLVGRCIILNRPPVATLYESVIFVSLITVLFSIVLERRRKDGIGILIGSLMGAVLQFIGFRYASEGDSMGMLVAVLNTNFWLATHVVTITIGYGACIVASVLAHVYLIQRYAGAKLTPLNNLLKNVLGISLVAFMFSVLGTILGGIWADQSWGRFWGWDPKENGAMLICLWLIFALHGRIAGMLKPLYFALAMVVLNICVALAWFGVNLLNVGLHSYGFTEGIALNLFLFCLAEILFMLTMWKLITHKERRENS